jgi:hypothetical protein
MEVQVRLLIKVTPRFIQIMPPLPPLKPMGQFHALIEPSALRATKALLVE